MRLPSHNRVHGDGKGDSRPSLHDLQFSAGTREGVSAAAGYYGQLAMAVDSHGAPHVAVTTTNDNGIATALSYLSLNGNVWQAQQVAGYVSTYSPLALDAQDNTHIAYGPDLTHAFYDGSEWQFEDTGASIS